MVLHLQLLSGIEHLLGELLRAAHGSSVQHAF